jgi:hypothetical protein
MRNGLAIPGQREKQETKSGSPGAKETSSVKTQEGIRDERPPKRRQGEEGSPKKTKKSYTAQATHPSTPSLSFNRKKPTLQKTPETVRYAHLCRSLSRRQSYENLGSIMLGRLLLQTEASEGTGEATKHMEMEIYEETLMGPPKNP